MGKNFHVLLTYSLKNSNTDVKNLIIQKTYKKVNNAIKNVLIKKLMLPSIHKISIDVGQKILWYTRHLFTHGRPFEKNLSAIEYEVH